MTVGLTDLLAIRFYCICKLQLSVIESRVLSQTRLPAGNLFKVPAGAGQDSNLWRFVVGRCDVSMRVLGAELERSRPYYIAKWERGIISALCLERLGERSMEA